MLSTLTVTFTSTHPVSATKSRIITGQTPKTHLRNRPKEKFCSTERRMVTLLAPGIWVSHYSYIQICLLHNPKANFIDMLAGNKELLLAYRPWPHVIVCATYSVSTWTFLSFRLTIA